jgi:hypothetical protein
MTVLLIGCDHLKTATTTIGANTRNQIYHWEICPFGFGQQLWPY